MNILLIDLGSIAYPIWHISASEPNPDFASIKMIERVRALVSGQPHAAVCCDSGRSFRKDISPTYKANRPATEATLQHQIALAQDVLKGDGIPLWSVPNFEADDLIASAVFLAQRRHKDIEVKIASADKDLLQLVNGNVTIHSLRDGSMVDADVVKQKFGVRPDQIRDYLSLVGDTSDNIVGAKGVGPKRAAELLNKYDTLDGIYKALTTNGTAFTPGLATALREFEPRRDIVRDLILLRIDAPVPFDEVFRPRVPTMPETTSPMFSDDIMADIEEAMPDTPEPPAVARPVAPEPAPEPAPAPTAAPVSPPIQTPRVIEPEVVDAAPADFQLQLEPRNIQQAKQLSADMHAARLFSQFGSAPAVLAIVLSGREFGIPAMASLRAFDVIDGRVTMKADFIRAIVLKSGKAEYFRCVERTTERATFTTKRHGDPEVSLTYTVAEAKQAWRKGEKAWEGSGWAANPADMCVARAGAKLARLVYSDVTHGLYAAEEAE